MTTEARAQIERAAQTIAATIKRDVVVYRLPSGAIESRNADAPAPAGGELIYAAPYCEIDLLRSFR